MSIGTSYQYAYRLHAVGLHSDHHQSADTSGVEVRPTLESIPIPITLIRARNVLADRRQPTSRLEGVVSPGQILYSIYLAAFGEIHQSVDVRLAFPVFP